MKRRTVGKRPVEATLRRDLDSLQEYTPIQLPGSLPDDGRGPGGRIVKADGNENVYGPSPRVLKALAAYDGYHIYPDPDQRLLRKALARYTGVAAEHIVAGAGSDEIIDLLLRLVVEPKDETITATPTFGMYTFSTQVCGGKPVEVPRTSDYHVDTQAVLGAVTKRTKAIFIASPNNPTGTLTSRKAVLELLESDLLVVIDEAYYEFCGETVADLVPKHENL
ncbi:MAG: aminotransferase class I/II-fold pyridoxal phosphate-dependent enzyme, partial [Chloroflexi bacterium]|nr:aminotransferase class I/II-fold pyridoxal phosphate-dependent enzyme [Chloroflexota bacterium]